MRAIRIFIDTNILIAAALWPNGKAAKAYYHSVNQPFRGIICEYNIEEMYRVFNRKFPQKIQSLKSFLAEALLTLEVVKTPEDVNESESKIRDPKDRPILRAAIAAKADYLLTGDLDFLESEVTHPTILSASEFLDRIELYGLIQEGSDDIEAGKTKPFKEAIKEIRDKRK